MNDEIGSFNGRRGTPQDKLAVGCAWFFWIIVGFCVFGFVWRGFYEWMGWAL